MTFIDLIDIFSFMFGERKKFQLMVDSDVLYEPVSYHEIKLIESMYGVPYSKCRNFVILHRMIKLEVKEWFENNIKGFYHYPTRYVCGLVIIQFQRRSDMNRFKEKWNVIQI